MLPRALIPSAQSGHAGIWTRFVDFEVGSYLYKMDIMDLKGGVAVYCDRLVAIRHRFVSISVQSSTVREHGRDWIRVRSDVYVT